MLIPNYDNLNKKKKNEKEHLYKELHPFYKNVSRTLICGGSGSGKTNLLAHILLSPLMYYEQCTIFTKTPDQPKYIEMKTIFDKIAKDAKIPEFFFIVNGTVPDPDTLDDKIYRTWVFDDMILEKKEFEKIAKTFVLGRHKKISPIFLSQSYFATPKVIRINCSHFHLFGVGGRREIRLILQDHPGITEKQYIDNTLNFGFISINKLNKFIGRNLDEPLE
jgi:energy-coupling factor transporter ATP-binding protein EcfA2